MIYLWDTCVLSELARPAPDPGVLDVIASLPMAECAISVITIGEIERGLRRLPFGKRRVQITDLMRQVVDEFRPRILGIDEETARTWGAVSATVSLNGFQLSEADGLIAATAIHHKLTVVTRNVRDFIPTGVELMNPWAH